MCKMSHAYTVITSSCDRLVCWSIGWLIHWRNCWFITNSSSYIHAHTHTHTQNIADHAGSQGTETGSENDKVWVLLRSIFSLSLFYAFSFSGTSLLLLRCGHYKYLYPKYILPSSHTHSHHFSPYSTLQLLCLTLILLSMNTFPHPHYHLPQHPLSRF